MTFKGVSASWQICVMSFSEDIQSTFHIYVNIHIVGEIRWYLGLFEWRGKIVSIFQVEGLPQMSVNIESWAPKSWPNACVGRGAGWVVDLTEGGEGWLPVGQGGCSLSRQPAFWQLPEHRAGGSAAQDQVVCVVPAYACSPVLVLSWPGPALWLLGQVRGGPWLCSTGGAELGV